MDFTPERQPLLDDNQLSTISDTDHRRQPSGSNNPRYILVRQISKHLSLFHTGAKHYSQCVCYDVLCTGTRAVFVVRAAEWQRECAEWQRECACCEDTQWPHGYYRRIVYRGRVAGVGVCVWFVYSVRNFIWNEKRPFALDVRTSQTKTFPLGTCDLTFFDSWHTVPISIVLCLLTGLPPLSMRCYYGYRGY